MALHNETPKQLKGELDGARHDGLAKACLDAEAAHGLPHGLLLAVASRETNCRNVIGDGGHGRGVFQIDDPPPGECPPHPPRGGSPPIPDAAAYAASILASGLRTGKKL